MAKKYTSTRRETLSEIPHDAFQRYSLGALLIIIIGILGYLLYTNTSFVSTGVGCSDPDGRNYFDYGELISDGQRYKDTCSSTTHVTEFFCDKNSTRQETVYCEHGCDQGTCRNATRYCGGRYNISCEDGLACDYNNLAYIPEVGVCTEKVRDPVYPSKANYTYLCYVPDISGEPNNFYLKNQLIYYVTNEHMQKIVAPLGVYLNNPKNVTWELRLFDNFRTTEYMKRLFSIREGKNSLGNITCQKVGKTPPFFQEFINNHPFLYKRKLITTT